MQAYRSTPHSSTLETPNFLMLGKETRVFEHVTYHVLDLESNVHDYVEELVNITTLAVSALFNSNQQTDSTSFCSEQIWLLRALYKQIANIMSNAATVLKGKPTINYIT